eukprot:TRINITY_DN5711_c0_g1_i1.p1 TRINITY_DN5711_c0_g1~~TRINITY_DN5711_c0_g1_i1.p1  ORF type:complete len:163 (-),score=66.01 TRINITY_DN5711_c0_g1_i1:55-543(-)
MGNNLSQEEEGQNTIRKSNSKSSSNFCNSGNKLPKVVDEQNKEEQTNQTETNEEEKEEENKEIDQENEKTPTKEKIETMTIKSPLMDINQPKKDLRGSNSSPNTNSLMIHKTIQTLIPKKEMDDSDEVEKTDYEEELEKNCDLKLNDLNWEQLCKERSFGVG